MHNFLVQMLVCPVCHYELEWEITEFRLNHIEKANAICQQCSADYLIRDGIGIFLTPDLPRVDLWEQADSLLMQYLKEHPEIKQKLMGETMESLSAADVYYRAMVLEADGDFLQAKKVEDIANKGIYTSEYLACMQSQQDYLLDQIESFENPIIDLASGRGYLVEAMAHRTSQPIIATDFSLQVLRRNKSYFEYLSMSEQISLLAFDARNTPFRDDAVITMTTNLGLANIEDSAGLVKELRRVVSGEFLAIVQFYPENDQKNVGFLQEAGMVDFSTRTSALQIFSASGWSPNIENSNFGIAHPTPKGEVLEGAE